MLQNILNNGKVLEVSATPESAIIISGISKQLYRLNGLASPEQSILVARTIQKWFETSKAPPATSTLYQALFLPENALRNPKLNPMMGRYKTQLAALTSDPSVLNSIDQSFLILLVTRSAINQDSNQEKSTSLFAPISKSLNITEKLLDQFESPILTSSLPHEDALTLNALADTLLLLEKANPVSLNQKSSEMQSALLNRKSKLQAICLLHYYRALQQQTELGGLWPDPVDSLLYLTAAEKLKNAGLFKDFKPQRALTLGKKQDEKVALPEVIKNLNSQQLILWTTLKSGINSKDPSKISPELEGQLRRKMATLIWEHNQYLNFSREQTRYLVNEDGQVTGGNTLLAAGAF